MYSAILMERAKPHHSALFSICFMMFMADTAYKVDSPVAVHPLYSFVSLDCSYSYVVRMYSLHDGKHENFCFQYMHLFGTRAVAPSALSASTLSRLLHRSMRNQHRICHCQSHVLLDSYRKHPTNLPYGLHLHALQSQHPNPIHMQRPLWIIAYICLI